jgi:broad specificity phosphatase PhoE
MTISSSFETPPAKQRRSTNTTSTTRQQYQEGVPNSAAIPFSADNEDRRILRQSERDRQGLWNGARSPKPPSFKAGASTNTSKVGCCDNESLLAASNSSSNGSNSGVLQLPVGTKTVYLIRHGESLGQCAENRHQRQTDSTLLDCGLSERGIEQALALKQCLQTTMTTISSCSTNDTDTVAAAADAESECSIMAHIQLVLCSPLTRALQTACLVFGQDDGDEDDGTETSSGSKDRATIGSSNCTAPTKEPANQSTGETAPEPAPPCAPFLPIVIHYHLREIGSKIPENIPRPPAVVQHHLQTVPSPMISRRVLDTQVNFTLLLPEPTWPNDTTTASSTTGSSVPNALRRESIADILQWLAHARKETCIAVVCHYHVIRAALLQHQVIVANEMSPTKASMTTTTPLKSPLPVGPTTTTTPCSNRCRMNPRGGLASTVSSPGPRRHSTNLHPTNACLWRCDLNCATGRLTLVQVIR